MAFHVKLVLAFVASMLVAFGGCARFYVFGASESDAVTAIATAEGKIILCYDAVAEADAAGVNVTALLATLGEAGELLSRAESSYGVGDFDSAFGFANQSQNRLDGFVVDAEALTEVAIQENNWNFTITVGGSVVGTVVGVCGSFVVWHFLKKSHGGGVGA